MLPCRPKISEVLQRSKGPLGRRALAPSVVTTRTDSAVAAQDKDGRVNTAVLISCQCVQAGMKAKGRVSERVAYISSNKTQLICSFALLMSAF